MKSAILFLDFVLIFLFTASSLSTSILADTVLDFEGNPLEKDVGYFLSLPGSKALGGRVLLNTPTEQIDETCEAEVILVRVIPISGTPFTFTPVNGSEDATRLLSPLTIQSPSQNPCGDSTIWKISYREELLTSIITTGGINNTMSSCFHIVKNESQANVYGIEHCRGTCGPTREATICYPVGTTQTESGEHLSVGGNPLWLQFVKDTISAAKQDVIM